MAKQKQEQVTFIAQKVVKEPSVVRFNTKNGKVVFIAERNVKKPQIVSFATKKK